MIDANEGFSVYNSGISKILIKTQMCDPIFLQHGSINKPNTNTRGSKRTGFTFCTPTISQFIISSIILPFDTVTIIDHRTLYIDKIHITSSMIHKLDNYTHVLQKVFSHTKNVCSIM